MKKMFVLVVVAVMITGQSVLAAGDNNISREAKESFGREFPGAEFATWENLQEDQIYAVRFVYENQGFVAYFYPHGEMIASARMVTQQNLPYKVSTVVKKQYANAEILKIEELTMEGTLSYFFTIEVEGNTIGLRVYHDGTIEELKSKKLKANNGKE